MKYKVLLQKVEPRLFLRCRAVGLKSRPKKRHLS